MTIIFSASAVLASGANLTLQDNFAYRGMCDASAAAALGPDLFVVANDERNVLKVYRRGEAGHVDEVDLAPFLCTEQDKEADLEGAATIGTRIYWISSHGRNKKGKLVKSRHRFFATELQDGKLTPVGNPYTSLLDDMIAAPHLQQYPFAQASSLMPEADGAFNIEGLAATPQGGVLIGLRNPAPRGMALVVPLLNPAQIVDGARAVLGEGIELDLGGQAIRSMELVNDTYIIVAGPPADHGRFALYRWSGAPQDAPVEVAHDNFDALRPEAIFAIPGSRKLQILSDNGGKHVKQMVEQEQYFQSVTIDIML